MLGSHLQICLACAGYKFLWYAYDFFLRFLLKLLQNLLQVTAGFLYREMALGTGKVIYKLQC